jgi:hypothetical protein
MTFFGGKTKKTSKKKTQNDEFAFTLTDIDVPKLDTDFHIERMKNIGDGIVFDMGESTSLERLGISTLRREPLITTIAEDKRKIYTYVSLYDIVTKKQLPAKTNICCYGCRRRFTTQPIGIPIEFHQSVYVSKTDAKIRRLTERERLELQKDENNTIVEMDYFDTEGIVCSFNCIYLCIEESPSSLYKKTHELITKLYQMIFGDYPTEKINKAPNWRLREEYGGPLSDEEFEKTLQTIQFIDAHQIHRVQRLMSPVGRVYEARDIDPDKK